VFLALAFPNRWALVGWLTLSVVVTLNLLAAIPPTREIAEVLPIFGPLGVAGSLAMTTIAVTTVALIFAGDRWAKTT